MYKTKFLSAKTTEILVQLFDNVSCELDFYTSLLYKYGFPKCLLNKLQSVCRRPF